MKKIRRIKIHLFGDIPDDFTGIAEKSTGTKVWCRNGKFHRGNDLPAIKFRDGTKEWHRDGKLHREKDKPAIEFYDESKEWWKNGKRHRANGKPAINWPDGNEEYYINDKLVTKEAAQVYALLFKK